MGKINEKELNKLFCKLKRKEKNAYEELYQKYSSLVYQIAFSILKNKENAEDVMQNVFIKIVNLSKEKLPSKYEASWLYSVTKNEAISYIRKNKETMPIEDCAEKVQEDEIEEVMQKESYEKMISSLEQKEKQIISLKVDVGLSFKEIASLLNMPIGTIQWKYYKSLHTLKLLIGNLSLFIVTATLSITKLLTKERKQENLAVEELNENTEEEKDRITEDTIIEETIQKDKNDSYKYNEQMSLENSSMQSEKLNQEVIEDTITQNNIQLDFTDVILIGITSIFLCFTIFFTIIFANHQQNKNLKI